MKNFVNQIIVVSKTLSDFALEFRTARERAIELEERANSRKKRNPGRKITQSKDALEVFILKNFNPPK
jgi:hypothetical protein